MGEQWSSGAVVELEEREKKWEEGKKSRAARKGRILKPNINNHEWICKIKPDWFHSSFQTHTKILTKRGLKGFAHFQVPKPKS